MKKAPLTKKGDMVLRMLMTRYQMSEQGARLLMADGGQVMALLLMRLAEKHAPTY